jgi:thiaminase/transcriptional activator TenA
MAVIANPPVRLYAEWITLHDNPNFRGFVDLLRAELDRVGPAQADLCRDFFCRAAGLELSFFEAAYTTSVSPADLGTANLTSPIRAVRGT